MCPLDVSTALSSTACTVASALRSSGRPAERGYGRACPPSVMRASPPSHPFFLLLSAFLALCIVLDGFHHTHSSGASFRAHTAPLRGSSHLAPVTRRRAAHWNTEMCPRRWWARSLSAREGCRLQNRCLPRSAPCCMAGAPRLGFTCPRLLLRGACQRLAGPHAELPGCGPLGVRSLGLRAHGSIGARVSLRALRCGRIAL